MTPRDEMRESYDRLFAWQLREAVSGMRQGKNGRLTWSYEAHQEARRMANRRAMRKRRDRRQGITDRLEQFTRAILPDE